HDCRCRAARTVPVALVPGADGRGGPQQRGARAVGAHHCRTGPATRTGELPPRSDGRYGDPAGVAPQAPRESCRAGSASSGPPIAYPGEVAGDRAPVLTADGHEI